MHTLAERLQQLVGTGFRVERELPLGGMSRLYVARDLAVERDVVVKVLPPDLACTASTARFRREVELTAQLLHPNIVPVLSAGGADDVLYYVTPFVPGESLRELVEREGALPLDAVRRVLDDVLDALAYAHSRGVVHRDVKPGNILLAAGGRAMLADFGIARALSAADRTGSEIVPGTPAYMAPEHPSDAQADLWATCVVVHEMLTGTRPAPGVAAAEVVRARARVVGTREARRATALATVVARGLAVDPARRFADVEALRAAVVASGQRRLVTRRRLVGTAVVATLALAGFAATRPSMEAARARERGRAAEARFELDSAIAAYREALGHDTTDASLHLALARVLTWKARTPYVTEAAGILRRLGAHPDYTRLAPAQRAQAAALLELADGQFQSACARFDSVSRAAPGDVHAWIGLAECRRRDDVVVPSSRAPGEFVFRTGFHGAAAAYERALDIVPTASLLYERLTKVLITESNRLRGGQLLGDTATRFHAYPEVRDDTVSFHPDSGSASSVPPTRDIALEINRDRLRRRFVLWTSASSDDPAAHRALAGVLEAMGYLVRPDADDHSALAEIRRARALTRADSTLPLIQAEVRLLMKAAEWSAAAHLADSALTRWRGDSAETADRLLGMAVLTGQRARAYELAHRAATTRKQRARLRDDREVEVHPQIMVDRARLMVAAAALDCEQVAPSLARLERSIGNHLPGSPGREEVARALLERPSSLAVPCLGPSVVLRFADSRDPLVRLQAAAARRDRRTVQRTLRDIDDARRFGRPGDAAIDYVFREAWVMAYMGDTSSALTRLDVALDGLPSSGPYALSDLPQAAAIPAVIELAARLARVVGDTQTEKRWTRALAALWAQADTPPHASGTLEERQGDARSTP